MGACSTERMQEEELTPGIFSINEITVVAVVTLQVQQCGGSHDNYMKQRAVNLLQNNSLAAAVYCDPSIE